MANMAGNDYQKMARQIMEDMALQEREAVGKDNAVADGHAPEKKAKLGKYMKSSQEEQAEAYDEPAEKLGPNAGKEPGQVLARMEAELKAEGWEEGTDGWNAELSNRVIDAFDGSVFIEFPAEKAFAELGLNMSPEDAEMYDAADIETRAEMLDYLTNGGPVGGLKEFEDMASDAETGSAPMEMQPEEEEE